MKQISLLGSTGSIGKNVLHVARHLKEETVKIVAIAAHSNIDLLYQQAQEFNPELIAVFDEKQALELAKRLPKTKIVSGVQGLQAAASYSKADLIVNAIVGNAGLAPMHAALEAKKNIALANKEVLVSAGELIMKKCKENNCTIIPIDSEHSAIFQCLQGYDIKDVNRLILTASGGPFLHLTSDQMQKVTLEQALKHPTWTMGSKITIDSSTLMNKGFEVIEAHWLFNIPIDQIEVIIHPQSIIHSMVEFTDNSILAQMGEPSMITPIQLSLTYPKKYPGSMPYFNFTKNPNLQFMSPNFDQFLCLKLAYLAQKQGGSYPCFLNAANEVLVERFLNQKINWIDISKKLEKLFEKHSKENVTSIDHVLEIDRQARMEAKQI